VDVEASVSDGGLDIGVFGSRRRLPDRRAAQLVTDVVARLKELN